MSKITINASLMALLASANISTAVVYTNLVKVTQVNGTASYC